MTTATFPANSLAQRLGSSAACAEEFVRPNFLVTGVSTFLEIGL
jgi:hypothetical protein